MSIDDKIAERVMGWEKVHIDSEVYGWVDKEDIEAFGFEDSKIIWNFKPTEDMQHTNLVIEKLDKKGYDVEVFTGAINIVRISDSKTKKLGVEKEIKDRIESAICEAALETLDKEVERFANKGE